MFRIDDIHIQAGVEKLDGISFINGDCIYIAGEKLDELSFIRGGCTNDFITVRIQIREIFFT